MPKSPPNTDLSGPWAGVYNYPSHPQAEHFDAVLYDVGGVLTGTTHEMARLMLPPRQLDASIDGWQKAGEVRFVKTYAPGSGDDLQPIVYTGHTNADSTEISGTWAIRTWISGTFLMIRQQGQAEEIAEKRLAEITVKG